MAKYGFLMDVSRCSGCYACFLACKDEYIGNDHAPYSLATEEGMNLIKVQEFEYGTDDKVKVDYVAVTCQHCDNPECVRRFPDVFCKREDGLVLMDETKATDRAITSACPYGAIQWNPVKEIAQKCNGCAHMLDNGEKLPRCAECCPNQALFFGDLDDPNSDIAKFAAEHKDELEDLHPEFNTKPTFKYLRLPKPFICGEVTLDGEDVKGAKVVLKDENGNTCETVTDFLGDFQFKYLAKNAGYTVTICADGCKEKVLKTRTRAAVNFGEIALEKA